MRLRENVTNRCGSRNECIAALTLRRGGWRDTMCQKTIDDKCKLRTKCGQQGLGNCAYIHLRPHSDIDTVRPRALWPQCGGDATGSTARASFKFIHYPRVLSIGYCAAWARCVDTHFRNRQGAAFLARGVRCMERKTWHLTHRGRLAVSLLAVYTFSSIAITQLQRELLLLHW